MVAVVTVRGRGLISLGILQPQRWSSVILDIDQVFVMDPVSITVLIPMGDLARVIYHLPRRNLIGALLSLIMRRKSQWNNSLGLKMLAEKRELAASIILLPVR